MDISLTKWEMEFFPPTVKEIFSNITSTYFKIHNLPHSILFKISLNKITLVNFQI